MKSIILKTFSTLIMFLTLLACNNEKLLTEFPDSIPLNSEFSVEKKIDKDEENSYSIFLKNGEAILANINQLSIDVVIDIYDSDHQLLKSIDGAGYIEHIDFSAKRSDNYFFKVYPFDKEAFGGVYLFEVKEIMILEENVKRIAKKEIPSKTLYNLWVKSLKEKNVIDEFLNSHKTKHIIEPIQGNSIESRVTYFYVPSKDAEYVMQSGGPDFMGLRFKQLGNTKLFFTSHVVPNDALFNYGFNEFKLYALGPEEEYSYRDMEHVYDDFVQMPGVIRNPYSIENSEVKKGVLNEFTIPSSYLNEDRKITVYLPNSYDSNKEHKLLILFDGEEYGAILNRRAEVPTPIILDNLLANNKIEPTIAVMVWSLGKRNKDLISASFGSFIARELVSWARESFTIGLKPNDICVAGSSRGGYAASFIASQHSDIIGNVISQSGSFWITNNDKNNHWMYPTKQGQLIQFFKNSKKLPIRFYLDIGLYDQGASMLGMNREFRSIIESKGYDFVYEEFKGGHSYLNWKETLPNGVISIFGK
ncbi:alpha/beta hydrolase [Winogradskyella alexanderae]|uniref:Esterase family protein n=1 Tax=Winogradskyella alexanderae TaxID=2877123 RepID=A0ABS7XNZ1_9FLAO|nr:alpha/beta hydrolase-fold protein [Winogradskyella alexanderae]MCA0131728.1 esterase family protein [Winogradskyella alexanderae]